MKQTEAVTRISLPAAVAGAPFLVFLAYPLPIPLVPAISADLGVGIADLQLAVGGYPLGLGAALLAGGVLSDRFGGARVWILSTLGFALCSLGSAISGSAGELIGWRVGQGIAGAAMLACSLSLVSTSIPAHHRARLMAWWGAAIGAGLSVGPLLSAASVEIGRWRPAFLIVGVIGLVAVIGGALSLPRHRPAASSTAKVDVIGTFALALGLGALILAINRASADGAAPAAIALLALGVALLAGFAVLQRRRTYPMVDVSLLRGRGYRTGLVAGTVLAASMLSLIVLFGAYIQDVLKLTPMEVALWFLPWSLLAFLVALTASRMPASLSIRARLIAGLVLCAVGLLLLLPIGAGTSPVWLLPGFLIGGAGVGLTNPALAAAAVAGVPPERSGMAAGAANTARQLGNAVGIAGLAALAQWAAGRAAEASAQAGESAQVIGNIARGELGGALALVPADRQEAVRALYDSAQTTGIHAALVLATVIAVAGVLAVAWMSRSGHELDTSTADLPVADPTPNPAILIAERGPS
ncbi:MAG: MFS transporter [Actinomycetota bacterium]|nr:MFS transporter [Actinomycetota bacterium]